MCYLTRMNRFEMSDRARALRAALEENGIDPHAVLPGRTEGRHQALYVMLHQRLPAVTIPTQLSDGLEVRVVYYEDVPKVSDSWRTNIVLDNKVTRYPSKDQVPAEGNLWYVSLNGGKEKSRGALRREVRKQRRQAKVVDGL